MLFFLKRLMLLIALSLLFSCKKKIIITNEFKINFLNEILSDTIGLKLIISKNRLISNIPILPPPILPIKKDTKMSIKHSEFISKELKVDDIAFIQEQMKNNSEFDLNNLKRYKYQILDLKKYKKENQNFAWGSIDSIIINYNNEKQNNGFGFFSISKPIFNKKLNLVYLRVRDGMGGYTIILEKKHQKWRKKTLFGEWVE